MARFLSLLLWTGVFLLLLLAIDQLLVRTPATQPTHAAIATFYRDLRSRLIDLATGKAAAPAKAPATPTKPALPSKSREPEKVPAASIEAVIEQRQGEKATSPPAPAGGATPEPASRYLYADEQGTLHFAATLAEVPERYRSQARRLQE